MMSGVQAPVRSRRLPIGAEVQPAGGVHFRVRAPRRKKVSVVFFDRVGSAPLAPVELAAEPGGYFAGFSSAARAGSRYALRLDDDATLFPDPASRSQPDGPHGHSEVIDPVRSRGTDGTVRRRSVGPGAV